MKTHDLDAVTRGLDPTRSTTISDAAWGELSDGITSASVEDTTPVTTLAPRRRPSRPRLVLTAACTLLIAGVVAAAVLDGPAQNQPQALSFTELGDKLIVRVVDPSADPKRYNAEFKKMGLNVKVEAIPVSPPSVGRMIGFNAGNERQLDQLRILAPGEKCNGTMNASDPGCQDGLEVPKNYRGNTEIQFGRPAEPGEMYSQRSSSATEKGESLAGLRIKNKTVGEVLPLIGSRGVQVEAYYASSDARKLDDIGKPDDGWYVHGAEPYSPGKVVLSVGPAPRK
ncbi:hypothetical protein [Kribbella sp. CA-293567]|uniref:hypothetical protein n=1 Tax=Kribbella sp. CA-293567 TaxID=3002436 RepID=UPI0022DDD542|nr:hypothetical protein [Kribbella sp. CA-293567]WBQ05933.1 hypothetical protein OX958_03805 [Kribbella sp. CA-293567]